MVDAAPKRRPGRPRDQGGPLGVVEVEHMREALAPEAQQKGGPLQGPVRGRKRGFQIRVQGHDPGGARPCFFFFFFFF